MKAKQNNLISPVQPFFLLNTLHYMKKKIENSTIAHFYKYKVEESGWANIDAVPDGCIDVIFTCDPNNPEAEVFGSVCHCEPTKIRNIKGSSYFGVRFYPGQMPKAFNINSSELLNQKVQLKEIIKEKDILEEIAREQDFLKQVEIFLTTFSGRLESESFRKNPYLVSAVINMILNFGGNIKIDNLALLTNYSERYINKLFKENTGMSPKTFCKIIRFQKTIQALNCGESTNMADLAANMGYYDQSHLLQNFKDYAGVTPKEYINILPPENYKNRIFYY